MSTLQQRIIIGCPLAQADNRLRQFFKNHGNAEGDVAKFAVGVDLSVLGLSESMSIQREVVATVQRLHTPEEMRLKYNLQWAPATPGPFPLFAGTLSLESDEDYEHFVLELKGSYTPPLGMVGQGFDMLIGHRIAHYTAEALLRRVKAAIEHDFLNDEAKKKQVSPVGVQQLHCF